jgi:hypothetical protein
MTDQIEKGGRERTPAFCGRRRGVKWIGLTLLMAASACRQGSRKMQDQTLLTLVMYSYLDRLIYDIEFNNTGLGLANKFGGTGIITDVRIPFGIQKLEWTLGGAKGMPGNGERVAVRNSIVISPAIIPQDANYIGLHLYPDNTAEVAFNEFIPERTPRGEKILADMRKTS